MEEIAIGIDLFPPEKNLEIAQQMPDDEKEKGCAADGHDVFPAQRGLEQVGDDIHWEPAATGMGRPELEGL